jgi:hypothetical protein
MRPTRLLAFHEHRTCTHGHTLDVWILPRAPGAATEALRRCGTCETLFVVTASPASGGVRRTLEQADDSCPNCRTPLTLSRPYPEEPGCRECAATVRGWLTDGPDLPGSAASTIRCWAVAPATVDLRDAPVMDQRATVCAHRG